jgi:hypothetical protein
MLALSQALLWIAVLMQAVVICVLIRHLGVLRNRADAMQVETWLPAGTPAPDFSATDMRSGATVHGLDYAASAVFCFVSSDCGTCRLLATDIARQTPAELEHVVVCCVGTHSVCREFLATMPANVPVLLADDVEVGSGFRISSWPVAVAFDETAKISGYYSASSFKDIEPLLRRATDVMQQPALQGA